MTNTFIERRLDEERLQFEAKKREREEQHLFLTAKVRIACLGLSVIVIYLQQVITDETFSLHEGFDLATFDERNWPPSELPSFRVLKTENYSTFKSRVAHHFNYPENQIRLWVLVNRQNKTVRPDTPIPENEPALSMLALSLNGSLLIAIQLSKSSGTIWRHDRTTLGYTSTSSLIRLK